VRFWDLHPGVSRAQALRPLGDQIAYALAFGVGFLLFLALSATEDWRPNAGMPFSAALVLVMVGLAVWLRLAVRWVDRNGQWGGEYRPPAATVSPPPAATVAPPG
jgi:hypothetical protein